MTPSEEVAASSVAERVSLRILEVPSQDPHAIVKELQALNVSKLDGIAIMAPETPQIRDAIAHLKEEGLAVVALVSAGPPPPAECVAAQPLLFVQWSLLVCMFVFVAMRPFGSLGEVSYSCVFISISVSRSWFHFFLSRSCYFPCAVVRHLS